MIELIKCSLVHVLISQHACIHEQHLSSNVCIVFTATSAMPLQSPCTVNDTLYQLFVGTATSSAASVDCSVVLLLLLLLSLLLLLLGASAAAAAAAALLSAPGGGAPPLSLKSSMISTV
jgi:hypothetical protein